MRQHAVTVTTLNVKTPHVVKRYEGFFLEIVPLIIKVYNFDEKMGQLWLDQRAYSLSSHDWPNNQRALDILFEQVSLSMLTHVLTHKGSDSL